MAGFALGFVPLAIWLYLLLGRRGFWLLRERDGEHLSEPLRWPAVAAIVPARNEEDVIQRSVGSLLAQDYPGPFRVILVDDQSDDETSLRAASLGDGRLTVISGSARPPGWTGKLWAMQQGVTEAGETDYLWFIDADIAHAPDTLRFLAARAEKEKLVLVSLMARLRCESWAERFLIPAFVFFFDMLFPFAAVNDPKSATAAAAGGCMLARREALERRGGLGEIRHQIIDDCALARLLKKEGAIWLGLTCRSRSLRPYAGLGDVRKMVGRSAFAQLDYSPILLFGTLFGLLLVYIGPVWAALFLAEPAQLAAILAWVIMFAMFQPMLRFYRRSPLWGAALPLVGAVYAAFTLDSAIQYWSGKGGMWKGRTQAPPGGGA